MKPFLPQEVIRRKREGLVLRQDEIDAFIGALTDGSLSEGQAAAFAMAVYFRGLDWRECVDLTRAMIRSGETLDWSELDRPVLDKHSTGGVGDKVSLPLAAILAACGAAVPMISGRGLGHTGGTLDKLDAVPGYTTQPDASTFRDVVRSVGCAIIGQTDELAPADRRLYAIRDVTATVESTPLIVASILSKKVAAGLQGLVMDVKVGSGAFMSTLPEARSLAQALVDVSAGLGLRTRAVITDMNQVLGRTAGNALEVQEAVDYLAGRSREPRFHTVVVALAREALRLGGLAEDDAAAETLVLTMLDGGHAAATFDRMVAALGGPGDFTTTAHRHLPAAPYQLAVYPDVEGTIARIDVRTVGLCILKLGGGRRRAEERIDPAVGLSQMAGLGESVGSQRPLAIVHARREADARSVAELLRSACSLGVASTTPILYPSEDANSSLGWQKRELPRPADHRSQPSKV